MPPNDLFGHAPKQVESKSRAEQSEAGSEHDQMRAYLLGEDGIEEERQLKLLACFIKETNEGDGLLDLRGDICHVHLVAMMS